MNGGTFHRSLLPISSVSLLGSCETRFMEAMEGKQKVTKPMQIGKTMHRKLEEGLPKVSTEEIVAQIKEEGHGLYSTTRIIKEMNGDIFIVSGNGAMYMNGTNKYVIFYMIWIMTLDLKVPLSLFVSIFQ